jgi:gamma-glutamyltranspeptidase/glutathione hydrolase
VSGEDTLPRRAPTYSVRGAHGMVASVDTLASEAGLDMLRRGGSAADAVIAANAVLTVTLPNQCGLGGDLFALVSRNGLGVESLVAAGRAGSGADPDGLRATGHTSMPPNDPQSVTVPGCVDGWLALHGRLGRLDLADVMAPAIDYAANGFPVSAFAGQAILKRARTSAIAAEMTDDGVLVAGQVVRRPGAARVLAALAAGGRESVFGGEFGEAIEEATRGVIRPQDLALSQAEWTDAIRMDVWGHRVWSAPPPSQGYITLGAALMAQEVGLGSDPTDPLWPHLLIEAVRQAAFDRPDALYDAADPAPLLATDRLRQRAAAIDTDRAAVLGDSYRQAGTTYLCAVDSDGTAISLIQSNCMNFGSGLVAGDTGIWLQNRGTGFNLEPGHPAELGVGRRPPHTLAPALVTDLDDNFVATVGTRGGDSQPQIVLQLLARLLVAHEDPADALTAGRWILRGARDDTTFNTWGFGGEVRVDIEGHAPVSWADGLQIRGHSVERSGAFAHPFGHAQIILRRHGVMLGAADPRATSGGVSAY